MYKQLGHRISRISYDMLFIYITIRIFSPFYKSVYNISNRETPKYEYFYPKDLIEIDTLQTDFVSFLERFCSNRQHFALFGSIFFTF